MSADEQARLAFFVRCSRRAGRSKAQIFALACRDFGYHRETEIEATIRAEARP